LPVVVGVVVFVFVAHAVVERHAAKDNDGIGCTGIAPRPPVA
jgi:hypothetical protein